MLRVSVVVMVLAACSRGVQVSGSASPSSGSAATGTVIVANMGDHTATLIDVASKRVVATLPTGQGAHEVAVSRDGRWAVVSNYGVRGAPGNSLTVIDVASATQTILMHIAPPADSAANLTPRRAAG